MCGTLTEKGLEARRKYYREYMRKYRANEEKLERIREKDRERYKRNPQAHKEKMARYWNRKAEHLRQGEKLQHEGQG